MQIAAPGDISVDIHDLGGRLVYRLAEGFRNTGSFSLTWNGKDRNNQRVPQGAYLVTARFEGVAQSKRIVLR
jgi:flagellar hook assembly protein FlgD